ncbi:unnamed protein product [Prunus armeniaca]|uniref:WPP domain-containing protein n=1 Tax=Prunus armeniaca TaxID=36596 RepID=A0A6J5XME1_PRUAR|nr:unnamed protein product [Prunus armeniaca]
MDLESESVEDNEVNPQTVFHADDKDNDDGSNEIRNNGSCANVTENVANTRVNHVDTAQPVNLTLPAANSPGGGSPPTVKGHGLKKWKRIKRNFPRDDSDNAVDDSSKVLKRGLSGNGNPVKSKNSPREINHNSEGSVGSVNMLRNVGVVDGFAIHGSSSDSRFAVGSAFAAGADSENSEDRSSKSSTAASVPKAKYELPAVLGHAREKNRMKSTGGKSLNSSAQRAEQGRVQIESSKKHRGDRVKVEKENSYSSVESDSRSSNYVFMQSPILTSNGKYSGRSMSHDGENSDEVHANEQHYSEEVQTGYNKENVGEAEFFSQDDFLADLPWKLKGEKNKNRRSLKDQDPLFESILNLQSVQEALAKVSFCTASLLSYGITATMALFSSTLSSCPSGSQFKGTGILLFLVSCTIHLVRHDINGVMCPHAEVQKFGEIGKEPLSPGDNSVNGSGIPADLSSSDPGISESNLSDHLGYEKIGQTSSKSLEAQVLGLKQSVKLLESQLDESRAMLEVKESKVAELEDMINVSKSPKEESGSTIDLEEEKYRELETELEGVFRQMIEAQVEYIAIKRTTQRLKFSAGGQIALLNEQEEVAGEQAQMLNKLGEAEIRAAKLKERAEELGKYGGDIVATEEVFTMQKRFCKITSCLFIQMILLGLAVWFFTSQTPHQGVAVPT